MCGRFVVTNAVAKTIKIVKLAIAVNDTDNYNAHPQQKLPVIKSYTNGKTLESLQWGLTPSWTKEKKIKFNHCIIGEPTSNKNVGDKLKIGRRGSINFFLTVKGIQGHTANAHRAENPAHHLITFLHHIISQPLDDGNEYFLPSSIQIPTFDVGNSAANVIPEIAKATINIRFNNDHNRESLQQWLKKHISNYFSDIPR